MSRFLNLLRPRGTELPGETQQIALKEFPQAMQESGLRWWKPDMDVPLHGRRLLIGVATYSLADMRLLDLVEGYRQSVGSQPPGRGRGILNIDVIDVAACRRPSDFATYIPGITKVFATPVVGLWEEGALQKALSGAQARELISSLCNFSLPTDRPVESAG